MKQQWGEKPGAVIHLIAYTVIPIIMGGVLIVVGFRGVSLIGQ